MSVHVHISSLTSTHKTVFRHNIAKVTSRSIGFLTIIATFAGKWRTGLRTHPVSACTQVHQLLVVARFVAMDLEGVLQSTVSSELVTWSVSPV